MQDRLDPRIIGELLGLLAHDLRNPLSALQSNLGFLRSVVSPPEQDAREAVDDSVVSCDGLAHIIDNIDLFGQTLRGADHGGGLMSDLGALIADVVRACQPMAQSHGVELHLERALTDRVAVDAPRDLLTRALANVLRNSIQHSPAGGAVRVTARVIGPDVLVRVEDDGTVLDGPVALAAFTAQGQIASKSIPNGRYSRGLGLYCAALAASAVGATVRTATSASGNAFEVLLRVHDPRP